MAWCLVKHRDNFTFTFIVYLLHCVQTGSGAHPSSYSMGNRSSYTPGREADHLPPSSAEVKNTWSYTSTTPYVFMVWYFVKRRNKVTFH